MGRQEVGSSVVKPKEPEGSPCRNPSPRCTVCSEMPVPREVLETLRAEPLPALWSSHSGAEGAGGHRLQTRQIQGTV